MRRLLAWLLGREAGGEQHEQNLDGMARVHEARISPARIIHEQEFARAWAKSRARALGELQTTDEQFALVDHLRGKMVMQVDEEFFVPDQLGLPCLAVDSL